MSSEFEELAAALFPSAHQAGKAIMEHYGSGVSVQHKSDASPVTAADHASERILLAALDDAVPQIPVISEEAYSKDPVTASAEKFFLVDPLDGTKEFINRDSDFTVNIGLIEGGKPRFGIIYAPAHGDFFVTLSDADVVSCKIDPDSATPAFSDLNFMRIQTRAANPASLVAVVSRSHMDDDTRAFLDQHQISQTRSAGSSLKFCLLARGDADVYPRLAPTMEWDTAAGDAILRAAGGVVLQQSGAPLVYGKKGHSMRNPSFIAWGEAPRLSD